MKVVKRTFEAKAHAPGSPERARLNLSWVTSEYMPSYRYGLLEDDGTKTPWQYVTKREAQARLDAEASR